MERVKQRLQDGIHNPEPKCKKQRRRHAPNVCLSPFTEHNTEIYFLLKITRSSYSLCNPIRWTHFHMYFFNNKIFWPVGPSGDGVILAFARPRVQIPVLLGCKS